MSANAPRILYLLSHPIQYQSPLLRYLATSGKVDVHTVYGRTGGTAGYFDSGFGEKVVWDVPLTEGYSFEFLPAWFGEGRVNRFSPMSRQLGDVIHRTRPDAIWVHGYDHLNTVQMIVRAKFRKIPVLARAEVEDSDAHGGRGVRILKDSALRQWYRAIDGFLAIGERNRQFYLRHGVPPERVFAAPYAVDNARFRAAVTEDSGARDLVKRYDLPAESTVFVFSGKLIARKRPLDCVQGLRILVQEHGLNASLLFVGSGALRDEIEIQVRQLGLTDRVRFAGFMNQQEIASCYAAGDALLLTSERERWGLVANEAMAAGCPVISYQAVGCSEDLVIDDLSGYVVKTKDVAELAAAMRRICNRPTRARLSAGARERVADFSFEKIENGLVDALHAVTR